MARAARSPSYNVQLVTDTAHGLIVNVEATTDAIDYHQLAPALERCEQTLGRLPQQMVADGDYTNHASVEAAANCGVDFYGSWQESWKPGERDAQGRSGAFLASAFPYRCRAGLLHLPGGKILTHQATQNREHGVRVHVYHAPQEACQGCALRRQCAPPKARPAWVRSIHASEEPAATRGFQGQDGHRRSPSRFTANARASPSFPTPGLKNAAACASSAVAAS